MVATKRGISVQYHWTCTLLTRYEILEIFDISHLVVGTGLYCVGAYHARHGQ